MFRPNHRQITTNGDLSASFSGTTIKVEGQKIIAMQAVTTNASGLTGTYDMQQSNDGTNWHNVAGATSAVSANGAIMLLPTGGFVAGTYVRFNYTRTGGSGTVNVFMAAKE